MRVNIELDGELVAEAMAAAGLPTRSATIEMALRELVLRHRRRQGLSELAGQGWEGDLDEMREGRTDYRAG